jgi:multimeric flavodoxin WrbA
VQQILSSATDAGAKTEYFDVVSLKIRPCIACDKCHKTGYCTQKDDFQLIYDKIMASQGLVLGSPVYIYQVTAQLKNWIDRLGNTIHCQRFLGKYGLVVTTAGGTGEEETADYMESVLKRTGMYNAGRIARCIDVDGLLDVNSRTIEAAKQLGYSLVQAIREKKIFKDQDNEHKKMREYFRNIMFKRREKWSWEYDYWKDRSWI